MFKDMKIATKIMIGFVILDLIVVGILYESYSVMKKIGNGADVKSAVQTYNIITMLVFVLFLVVSAVVAATILGILRRSLTKLSDISRHVAVGDLNVDANKYSNDEVGQLMDDYQKVIDSLRYQSGIAEEVADGDMTIQVVPQSEEDVMGNSLKRLVERNYNALSKINEAAVQVTNSSAQVAAASESLAQGSTEQASAIHQITASIDEIAGKTKSNASQANEAAELITQAIEEAHKGNKQMQDMIAAMDDINKSSESISKIIKTIDDIAFQTNILALNAAVEAARAGEAGKGFAVVAEEVRNLAAKSASAASETAELIEDSINKVMTGSQIAGETAQALESFTNVVKQSESIIHSIAESSNYQATAVAQIDQAIVQVSEVVQTNSATSEECAAASEELSSQAGRMRDLLSVYKLGRGGYEGTAEQSVASQSASGSNSGDQIPVL